MALVTLYLPKTRGPHPKHPVVVVFPGAPFESRDPLTQVIRGSFGALSCRHVPPASADPSRGRGSRDAEAGGDGRIAGVPDEPDEAVVVGPKRAFGGHEAILPQHAASGRALG
jgi:hypothetical protein